MKKVAVVILNWNGKKLLEDFLPSVVAHTPVDIADVIVADNGSTDDSVGFLSRSFPQVGVIQLDQNYGFAEGYNRALEGIAHKYSVLLNSDVEVTEDWLQPLVDYLEAHPEVSACQPKILSYRKRDSFEHAGACGGFIDSLGYPFCRGRLFTVVEKDHKQYEQICPVFWATGAALFIRTADFREVGGLDGTFFAHMEEIDLCWRLKSADKEIVCIPQSVVYHLGAATLAKESPRKTYLNFRNNLLMLYKNLPAQRVKQVLIIRLMLDCMAMLQMALTCKFSNAAAVFRAIRDFYQIKNEYREKRSRNLSKAVKRNFSEMYDGSIVVDYYLKRQKKIKM